jgi:AraC-like DNA-binding protein
MLLSREAFRRLCRARDMLADLPEEAPSVRDVATEVAISHFHFIRQFEALFGVTPHQFRIHTRVERAKQLLASGGLSVTDVCMEIGFSSLGSFSEMFARRVGAPPSVYRRRARTVVQVPGAIGPLVASGCLGLIALLPPSAWARDQPCRPQWATP